MRLVLVLLCHQLPLLRNVWLCWDSGVGVDENIVGLLADDVRIGVLEGIANRLVE